MGQSRAGIPNDPPALRPVGPAQLRLQRAVSGLLITGRSTACQADPDAWFEGSLADRERAATECAGCPVIVECGAAADDASERDGVWAGRDRSGRTVRR
jgi:hypothetical protein